MKAYVIKKFSLEIKRSDLGKIVKSAAGSKEKFSDDIISYVIENDEYPVDVSDPFDNFMDAAVSNEKRRIDVCFGSSNYIFEIIGIIEEYETDEYGDFISGSNYDWTENMMTDHDFEKILDDFI